MNIGRNFALAATLLAASSVSAQEAPTSVPNDLGWNSQFGLLFTLENVFTNSGIIGGYGTYGVGGQYNLDSTSAVRLGLGLTRTSNPVYVAEHTETTINGGTVDETRTKTLVNTGGPTSSFGVGLAADYVRRLGTAELAPHIGGGLMVQYGSSATAYEDNKISDPDIVTTVDDSSSSIGLGARALLGIGWRLHKSIELYAEYGLGLLLFESSSAKSYQKDVDTANNVTFESKDKGSYSRFMNFSTGLFQGGSLGIIAFF